MNIRDQLLIENSKKNWQTVANYIGNDKKKVKELMNLYFSDEYRIVQRASQVISDLSDVHPDLFKPYLGKMIQHLSIDSIDAVRRNTMRLFQTLDPPEEFEGELFEKGMDLLKSAEAPKAVKAFAMTSMRRVCEKYPELAIELILQIELLLSEKISPGLSNRAQKELVKLKQLCPGKDRR